ncbi:hypothetical protein MHYP_G00124730 [Metynnis hypsauchen]
MPAQFLDLSMQAASRPEVAALASGSRDLHSLLKALPSFPKKKNCSLFFDSFGEIHHFLVHIGQDKIS